MKRVQKIFFAIFCLLLIAPSSFALALELSYPDIPGLGRLSDYQNIPQNQQIGFIVNYLFKLVFFISVGAGAVALIVSGVLYIVSLSKPRLLILAKQMASNAMLGLFILLCAYLFLYAINPQLLSLTLNKPSLVNINFTAEGSSNNTIELEQAPLTTTLTEAVSNLAEKVYIRKKTGEEDKYYEKLGDKWCLTDGYGGAVTEEGELIAGLPDIETNKEIKKNGCVSINAVSTDEYVYKAEIQIRQTADIVGEASVLVQELEVLLAKCKCGEANKYTLWGLGNLTNPECKAGLDPSTPAYTTAKAQGNVCAIQCQSCGQEKDNQGALICDLRDVRKIKNGTLQVCTRGSGVGTCEADKLATDKKTVIPDLCWKNFSKSSAEGGSVFISITLNTSTLNTSDGCGSTVSKIKPAQLIKWKTLQILELQIKLEARSRLSSNFFNSFSLMEKALRINKEDFIIGQVEDGYWWGYDAQAQVKKWTEQGMDVVLLKDDSANGQAQSPSVGDGSSKASFNIQKDKGILAKIKDFFAPLGARLSMISNPVASAFQEGFLFEAGTIFYVVNAPPGIVSDETSARNRAISRDGKRFNAWSVLVDLSLEEIEGIFKACLTSAFGSADYVLNKEQIESIAKATLDSGAMDHLRAAVIKKSDEIANAIVNGVQEAIVDDATKQYITKFYNTCKTSGDCSGKTLEVVAQEIKENNCGDDIKSAMLNTCCYCVRNLIDDGIPPRFVSNTITKLFTYNLGDALPGINEILETDTMDVLFPPDRVISQFLEKDTIEVYDYILQGALTENFDEQIPSLGKILDTPMNKILPQFVSDINNFFLSSIETARFYIKKYQEDFFKSLASQFIEQPIHQWADNWFDKAGIGTKNLTIGGCYDRLTDGYIYRVIKSEIDEYNNDVNEYRGDRAKPEPQEPGQCVKMTVGEINNLFSDPPPKSFDYAPNPSGLGDLLLIIKIKDYDDAAFAYRGEICENAGYSWRSSYIATNATKRNDYEPKMPEITESSKDCYEADNLVDDVRGAVETIQDTKKLKTYAVGGLVNYAEKLGVALTQTALQFGLAYARVFVEDRVVSPMITAWNTVVNFQETMNKFMTSSLKEALPAQISNFLQSNVEKELKSFCDKYETAKNAKTPCIEGDVGYVEGEVGYRISGMVVNLPNGWTTKDDKKDIRKDLCVSPKTGDKICQLEEHLGSKVLDEINYLACATRYTDPNSEWKKMCDGIFAGLRKPLEEALGNICVKTSDGTEKCLDIANWFNQTLAGVLFPEIKDIDKLIKATPKEVICGKFVTSDGNKIDFTNNATKYVEKQCQDIFSNKFGFIPQITTDESKLALVKNIMPWCNFINYACKIPVISFPCGASKTWGGFIKCVVELGCNILNTQISERPSASGCTGKCFCKYDCPSGSIGTNNCPKEQNICKFCNTTAANSVFYTLLYEAVKNEPKITDDNRMNEKEFYAQMVNDFPELANDIKAIATKRGLPNWQEILDLNPKPNEILTTFISGNVPNIIKILVQLGQNQTDVGQASIRSTLAKDEFLGATPYAVFKEKFCSYIIDNFESQEQNKDFTFDSVRAYGLDKIRSALPYTMESTQTFTLKDQIQIISNSGKSGADEYILCKVLDNTPQEIFGLDAPLRNYIQPKEYIILFDLLQDELSPGSPGDCRPGENFFYENGQAMCCDPTIKVIARKEGLCYKVGERPPGLNQLLEFMSFNDPISALRELQQSMPPEGVYSYVFPFYKSGESCLNVGTTISSCLSSIPQTLKSKGINIDAKVIAPTGDIKIYEGEFIHRAMIIGSVIGKDENGKDVNYYFVKPVTTSDLIFVFKAPNQAKAQFAATLNFMETKIGDLIKNEMGDKIILDYICSSPELQTEINGTPISVCDVNALRKLQNLDAIRKKIAELLGKSPVDLMEKYITKPFSFPTPLGGSLMDMLSANTALGQPIVDTLFRMFGAEEKLFGAVNLVDKKAEWLDTSVMKGIGAIQDGLETALVDWPKQAGKSIAGFFGFEFGNSIATNITGKPCYDKPGATSNNDCEPGEILRNPTTNPQCCRLAEANACTPRCRVVQNATKKCNVLVGEMPEPKSTENGNKICCYEKVDSKTKDEKGNPIFQCQRCRAVNFEAGAKCREKDENNQGGETQVGSTCCSQEKYTESSNVVISDLEQKDIEAGGYCCTTVGQCITNKLSAHMETLAEDIADGKLRLGSLQPPYKK